MRFIVMLAHVPGLDPFLRATDQDVDSRAKPAMTLEEPVRPSNEWTKR
jgi:hypothetical protein